jgi:excisionase family DNA binding protein
LRTTSELAIDSPAPVEQVVWLAAADILDGWPQKLFAFLEDFQRVTKHRTTATGLSRSFGLLLREAKHLEDLGYSLPADALREFLTNHYTAGHLTSKACLFSAPQYARLLANRPWISLTEADEILRFRKGGSAALLQRGILAGAVHSARPGHRTVGLVTRKSVDQVAHDLKTALSAAEVRKLLGMGRVHELIKADLLRRAVWTKGGWRVPRSSVKQLVDSVSRSAGNARSNEYWLDIREATRQFGPTGLNLVRLLRLIQAGQVRVRRSANGSNLCDILVSATDVHNARTEIHRLRDNEDGFPLNRLSKVLLPGRPIKEIVLKKWIENGLLHASRRGRAWAVAATEIARFRAEYCLLETAAQLLQIHRKTLLRWISEGALEAVYGPRSAAGGGFYLLRRSDVEQLRTLAPANNDSPIESY